MRTAPRHFEAPVILDDVSEANAFVPDKFRGRQWTRLRDDGHSAVDGLGFPHETFTRRTHAVRCIRASLALTQFINARNQTAAMKWGLRVGVHSGAVVAGIVGKNKYAHDGWGDTVNIASRLESAGEVNKVNTSACTFELVCGQFECEYRGKLKAKGKGEIDMYFVLRKRVHVDENPTAKLP